jgi:hypothetical protein
MSSIIKVDTIQDQDGNNIINENANTITIGKSGDTVTVASGATFVGGGIEWQSSIVTGTTLSAVAGKGYWIDTTSNACTVTLPASASAGDQIIFVDYARNWGTNAITIDQNSLNYQGNSSPNPVYDVNGQTVNIVYSGATNGWIPVSDDDVTLETPQTYSADFLVIAGGGSGGTGNNTGDSAGGGGAGGYRTSTQTVNPGTVITITVGDGGASVSPAQTKGNSGSDSSISGSGLTTITSAGGGRAGGAQTPDTADQIGGDGGSGGGAGGGSFSRSGGSGNTPSTSPSQGNNGGSSPVSGPNNEGGGGGGGAGAVGSNAVGLIGGNGGDGTASSITGSSVTRAGGGGGGSGNTSPTTSVGGSGGGGAGGGGSSNVPAVNGTVNTGSGGGGDNGQPSGAGGKGVVILSMLDADYSGTTTGSPTVATGVSGKTVLTFNGSGSYTA